MDAKKIMIAETDEDFRDRISGLVLQVFPDVQITKVTHLQKVFLLLIREKDYDTILMSFELLGDDWRRYAKKLQAICHRVKLIYLTFNSKKDINKFLLSLGCFSCVLKTYEEEVFFHTLWLLLHNYPHIPYSFILEERCIKDTSSPYKDGKCYFPDGNSLTKRQFETLQHLSDGLTNKEIADVMNISEATVKLHINGLLKKLFAKNRSEAVKIAIQLGFLTAPRAIPLIKVPNFLRKKASPLRH